MSRFLVLLALPLLLLSAPTSSTPAVGDITAIVVEQNGLGPEAEGCRLYVVTSDQARDYFAHAVLISGRQKHDYFLHGPCFARGAFKSRYDTWIWEIRSLGTATITATNGDVFELGDPRQESLPE